MNNDTLPENYVYSPAVIEFVTVVAETCIWLEQNEQTSAVEFVDKAVKILPLLYLKATILEKPAEIFGEMNERFVNEEDYSQVKEQIEVLLGEKDSYLETFHPDMALSDTPIAAFVSEDLADVYQELKDLAANYQSGDTEVMSDALTTCLEGFREHWGRKVLNALKALHQIKTDDDFGLEEETTLNENKKIDRNNFLNFLRDEEEEDLI